MGIEQSSKIERFPTNDTKSQAMARRLLKEHPEDIGAILKDLRWFYRVSSGRASDDWEKKNWADQELQSEENAKRWNRLTGYGQELSPTQLRDLIWHLERSIESFPTAEWIEALEEAKAA